MKQKENILEALIANPPEQIKLRENILEVKKDCMARVKPNPCEILKDLGICVPWKGGYFVNWKTDDKHLGMDFASRLANMSYFQLTEVARACAKLANRKGDFDIRDWDLRDVEDEYNIIVEPEGDIDDCTIHAKVVIDGIEYAAFYDMCNLFIHDKTGKEAELDLNIKNYIMSELDDYLGV